ncbi:platelet-derived growth factor receptor alpha [Folsomia candida]|uniref:Vascular endothelial growth factor receptor 1 n=1 Tax=Folsomia candida TaxID=158441 RepID=A0A226F266_FOLCA|nr:platelet-derived growth factor receptor alpha [Folsomia candida]OXA63548.1 Vascular endothelial growth factor receptor 1 [Folsomia candida]
MGFNLKYLLLQPCMGFFLQGAVTALAIVEVGVNFGMIILASVDYSNQFNEVKNSKEFSVSKFCGHISTWIYCYLYKIASIILAIRLFMIVSQRNSTKLRWWLYLSGILYSIWLCCFLMNSIFNLFHSSLSLALYGALGVYKLYFFWIIISFILEIERNGAIDPALRVLSDKDLNDFFKDGYVVHDPRYQKTFEIQFCELTLEKERPLGAGAFGIVYKASLTKQLAESVSSQIVAVKTVLPSADTTALKCLLRELQILNCIGRHENIVNLVGACTSEVKQGKLYVVVEYCALGNLQSYLKRHRESGVAGDDFKTEAIGGYISWRNTETETVTIQDLTRWAHETANGMEYISRKKVIHGDLAARNVLLTLSGTAKVADFGLSKQLYRYATYARHNKEQPIPWRWMAWECLDDLKFTTHSDSWSYGITVWEYFSLGALPFPAESLSSEFVQKLKNGQSKPDQPAIMSTEIYHQLCKCWAINPQERPSFTELKLCFSQQLDQFGNTDSQSAILSQPVRQTNYENIDQSVVIIDEYEEI